ncbi:endo-beta-N-acetylglucosaminidase [Paenibacillus aceti]|uniref:SLH domain-containing protein n=1 Tax=Paenibacillus aceti TaxID=1820010 RepID=A0ABQ1W8B4_9BACL|nr:S-layer homology domain-containing protein [Paenibacillus aceti]GGG16225.1 hypothetical protein GCM10010913_42820 [Paenibacillus aceti]
MRTKHTRKIQSIILASVITATTLFGGMGSVAADTWPYTDEGKVGDNQPLMLGHRAYDIETWSPETDPYADLMRAEVPLQTRIASYQPTQANPELDPRVQTLYMAGDYGNSFNRGTAYNNKFSENNLQSWQYIDQYYSWHGAAVAGTPLNIWTGVNEKDDPTGNGWATQRNFEFGSINMPNPAYTNAAHKNGVLSMGCIYFDPNNRPGQPVELMLDKDENGRYILVDKLVEFAKWYGFDGYFFNYEENMNAKYVPMLKSLMQQVREAGMYTQMYDSLKNAGNIDAWKSTLDQDAYSFLQDPTLGKVLNSVFISYDWSANGKLAATLQTAEQQEMSQADMYEKVFFGVEADQGKMSQKGHNSTYNFPILRLEGSKNPVGSIALFTPDNFIHDNIEDAIRNGQENNRAKNEYQWMVSDREHLYFSGPMGDPTKTGVAPGVSREDLGLSDIGGWVGVADYMSERSVAGGNMFMTTFNTGHGLEYRMNGKSVNDEEWSNINLQSILPTWKWWMDTSGTKLQAIYDYGSKEKKYSVDGKPMVIPYQQIDPYEGGSSLAIYGRLDADNEMHLYKTDIAVKEETSLSLTYNVPNDNLAPLSIGLIFKDSPNTTQYIDIPNSDMATDGWVTQDISISQFANKNIAAITLKVNYAGSPIDKFQVNLGRLSVSDNGNYTPAAPQNVKIEKAFNTKEMIVSWEIANYNLVKEYHVYANYADGHSEFLGGIYGSKYYVKSVDNGLTSIEVRATGADGSESEGTKVFYSYDSTVSNVSVEEAQTSTGFFTQSAVAEEVRVSWNAPKLFTADSYKLDVTLNNSLDKTVYSATTQSLSGSVSVPVNEGNQYSLKITPVKDGIDGIPVWYTGYLKDTYCAPFDSKVEISGNTLLVHPPKATDWWKMRLTWNGEELNIPNKYPYNNRVSDGIRGVARLNAVKVPTTSGTLGVTIQDYSGNISETVYIQVGKVESVTITPNDVDGLIGTSLTFKAEVRGTAPDTVTWDVYGNSSDNTTISDGVLTIAADEKVDGVLTVTATSTIDTTKSGTAQVLVVSELVPKIISVVIPDQVDSVKAGTNQQFTANVAVKNNADTSVTWEVEGATNVGTIVNNGLLMVNEDEAADQLTIKATSVVDPTKFATKTVKVAQDLDKQRDITIDAMLNGTVTADMATAKAGETVTLTVTPDVGYQLKPGSLKVNGEAIFTDTFTMPAKPVTITAEFEQDTTRGLVSIDAPSAVTGLPNGTAKTADALKLPASVTLVTYTDSILADVTWDVDASSYEPASKSDQVFTVEGTVTLPNGVLNPNNIPLTVSIEVAVDAEVVTSKELLSIVDLAAISGLTNGTAKTVADLKLPATVEIVTDNGTMDAIVDWDVDSANYDPSVKTEQTFTVSGVVTLPGDVVNTNHIPLSVSIKVTVAKEPVDGGNQGGNNNGGSNNGNGNIGGNGGSSNGGSAGTTTPPVTPPTGGSEATSVTTVSEQQFDEALATAAAEAAEQGTNSDVAIKLDADAPSDARTIKVTLSNDSLMKFVASMADTLTVSTPIGTMTFDRNTISSISKQATGTVTITVTKLGTSILDADDQHKVGDRPVVNFDINSGDKTISKFTGSVIVTIPYTLKSDEKPNAIVAYYINTAGQLEAVRTGKYDVTTKTITFRVPMLSQYAVGYNNIEFTDVAASAWYSDAVSFLAARDITNGLGNGHFGPETNVSRAQSLVMIMKAFGIEPDEGSENNFSDAGNTYYTGYLAAAKRLGITDGVGNNMFTPEKEVTRQEMFVLTYNTLKSINELPTGTAVKELKDFKDAGTVSAYAMDAMTFFVNAGVISGSNGNILPVDKATRAEFAQILYNIMIK